MKKITVFVVFLNHFGLVAQIITPEKLGFDAHSFDHETLGTINYYATKGKENKPLLVYLDGSGAFPLFQQLEQGIASTVVINYQQLQEKYKVILISKPGVPFLDKVGRAPNGFPTYDAPKEYIKTLSLDWRVESTNKIINRILEQSKEKPSKVILLGFSEGAQVAPIVATKNKHVSHVLLFGGNGLNQLFDPIITARLKSQRGQISEQQAQKEIDSLFKQYKEIYKNPKATDKGWYGHTYKRWASFTKTSPVDELVKLNIPIYIANGSLDENSVLSADYIALEFLKRGKTNLTYKTYPSYNHQFQELIFEGGQFKQAIPKLQQVMENAFQWLSEN